MKSDQNMGEIQDLKELTRKDWEDYLYRVYFGAEENPIRACINRAYLDFNRNLHGIGKINDVDVIKSKAMELIEYQLEELKTLLTMKISTEIFDSWHRKTCELLIANYAQYAYKFHVGQAQKWINMTMKYIYTYGEERIPGYEEALPYCLAPIDNILLQELEDRGFPGIECSWSRVDDYSDYLNMQNWIKNNFKAGPLICEFHLCIGKDIE
jgi:hypothetical protein